MSSNPFGALNDDSDDESPVVVQPTRTTTAPKASQPMTKTAQKKAAQAKKAAAAAAAVSAANANAKSTANSNSKDYNKEKHHQRTGGRDTHGRNAGGPGQLRQGKREFDRRSGTGHGKGEVKKNGAGAHNWGEPGTDGAEVEEAAAPVEGEVVEETEPEVVVVELTMDEYMAVREAKRTGEGFGAVKSTKVVAEVDGDRYSKDTNVQEGFMAMGLAKQKRVRDGKKQTKTRFTDVSFKVKSSDAPPPEREERRGGGDREGGFRGGRGGSRGGARGGRGGGAGGREGGSREGGFQGERREGGGFRGGRGGARGGARGGRGGARGGAAGPGPVGAGRPAPTGPRGAINPNDASAFPALGA